MPRALWLWRGACEQSCAWRFSLVSQSAAAHNLLRQACYYWHGVPPTAPYRSRLQTPCQQDATTAFAVPRDAPRHFRQQRQRAAAPLDGACYHRCAIASRGAARTRHLPRIYLRAGMP
ncbi:hypothetical protein NPIL_128241 [Nephila pilipes]|uniref:Uncharacterized protein n=1 Tax=Nephila pilipes TaxID=299642 RepID=A0A8X6P8I8_NEPPI|nr:hypothetical protein NPIL_128241 [Nephila pilipes]